MTSNFKYLQSNVSFQIWNHPDVLYEALQKENLANEQDLDVDDLGTAGTNSRCQSQGVKGKSESNALASPIGEATNSKYIQGIGFNPFQERANQVVTYEWVSTKATVPNEVVSSSFSQQKA